MKVEEILKDKDTFIDKIRRELSETKKEVLILKGHLMNELTDVKKKQAKKKSEHEKYGVQIKALEQ